MDQEERIQELMRNSEGKVPREQAELIVLVIAGGDDGECAEDELFRSVHGRLRRFLFKKLRDDRDVEDCLSDTRVRIPRKLATFRGRGKNKNGEECPSEFSTWCHGIAHNVVRELWKKRKRNRSYEVIESELNNPGTDSLDGVAEVGEIEGYPASHWSVSPESNAEWNDVLSMLTGCQERICGDPGTEDHDLMWCLTSGWVESIGTGTWATGQDIANACGSKLGKAYEVHKELLACMKAKLEKEREHISTRGERS